MGNRKPGTPPFVYVLAHIEGDDRVGWIRCPVLRIEDGMLIFGTPSAGCWADLKQPWVKISHDVRRPGEAGRVDYADLQRDGVVTLEALDAPGEVTNIFLRPRALGLSPEDQAWIDAAFMPVEQAA